MYCEGEREGGRAWRLELVALAACAHVWPQDPLDVGLLLLDRPVADLVRCRKAPKGQRAYSTELDRERGRDARLISNRGPTSASWTSLCDVLTKTWCRNEIKSPSLTNVIVRLASSLKTCTVSRRKWRGVKDDALWNREDVLEHVLHALAELGAEAFKNEAVDDDKDCVSR